MQGKDGRLLFNLKTMSIINPKNYFTAIIAALLILGIAIGSFVYGLVVNDTSDVDVMIEQPVAIPTGLNLPSSPPSVPQPTSPPPGN